ncbi:MAG: hypothetical protein HY259_09695, partial [Chloroflexi bacterium]|nr:hypothetical protein [Chloroflexota bacterium]
DMFRAQAAGYITPEERAYLGAWQSSQFGLYEAVESLAGGVRVEDALRGENSIVQDEIYAPTLNPHELYLGRLAPRDDDAKEFILSLVNVPAAEKEKVIAFGRDKYRLYADAHFGATWSDFLREMNYLFNHYLLDMKGEAPVAAGKVALPTREEFEKAAAIGLVTSEALKA